MNRHLKIKILIFNFKYEIEKKIIFKCSQFIQIKYSFFPNGLVEKKY